MNTITLESNLALSILAGMLAGVTAHAGTCTWNGGNWSESSNWSNSTKPNTAGGDNVVIYNAGTAGAVFNIDVEDDCVKIAGLTLGNSWDTPGNSFVVKGKPIQMTGDVTFRASGVVVSNDIVLAKTSPYWTGSRSSGTASATFAGDISELTANNVTSFRIGSNKFAVTFDGSVNLPNATLQASEGGAGSGTSDKSCTFNGPVCVKELKNNIYDSYDRQKFNFYATGNSWTTLQQGNASQGRFQPRCENALADTTVLTFSQKAKDATSGEWVLDMFGFNQSIDRIEGPESDRCYVRSTTSPADGATTLTLKGTANATAYANVQNNISLVYDPTDEFTQTFVGSNNTTKGTITVSNGTFRLAGNASFPNVTAITVADGATFDMGDAVNEGALAGVAEITVGEGAKFVMSAGNATPFTDFAVTLRLASTAEFSLPEGARYNVADIYIDGQHQPGGEYSGGGGPFKGSGVIYARESEVATVEATWDGGAGGNTAISEADNWEDDETPQLMDGGLLAHFANGGSEAVIDGTVNFKGVAFDGTSAAFALKGGVSDLAYIRELGVSVAANHNATNSVKVEVKADQCWTVGAGATLTIESPVTMAAPYSVTNLGPGKIVVNSANAYKGPLFWGLSAATSPQLEVFAPTNAFGESSDEAVTLWMKNAASGLVLHGTTIERPVEFKGVNNGSAVAFVADGTNRFTKGVKFSAGGSSAGTGNMRANFTDGRVAFEGGVNAGWPLALYMTSGGECHVKAAAGYNYVHTLVLGGGTSMTLDKDGDRNMQFTVLNMTGAGTVKFLSEDAATAGIGGGPDVGFYIQHSGAKLDLNGFDNTFSPTYVMSNGEVYSPTPAVWTTKTTGARAITSGVSFTGCAGFVLTEGSVTFSRSQASTNATVAVSGGTLTFAQGVTWGGATNVVVSGSGRLVMAHSRTFSKNAVLSISGTGVVEIPQGVSLNVGDMVVDGETVQHGTYGSAESGADATYAAHFAGGGTVRVGASGFFLIVR